MSLRSYDIAKHFYKGLQEKDMASYFPSFAEEVVDESEVNRLSKIVFAPDETGNPTSDIDYYVNCGDDGFREYMRRVLLQRVEGDITSDDPEVAGSTIKKNLMTYDEYFNAMDAYARSLIETSE